MAAAAPEAVPVIRCRCTSSRSTIAPGERAAHHVHCITMQPYKDCDFISWPLLARLRQPGRLHLVYVAPFHSANVQQAQHVCTTCIIKASTAFGTKGSNNGQDLSSYEMPATLPSVSAMHVSAPSSLDVSAVLCLSAAATTGLCTDHESGGALQPASFHSAIVYHMFRSCRSEACLTVTPSVLQVLGAPM